ncbi:hypothetical protein [Streptomyces niveus]|uniref:hypothetical protein n=1 Tax=Streptomyces niveus TaxID=193462 RepID=UPI003428538C
MLPVCPTPGCRFPPILLNRTRRDTRPLLIVSPTEKPRLIEIRDNLTDRIAEAEREGWLGEVEGLSTSLAAAEEKITQLTLRQEKRKSPVFLGVPAFDQVAGRKTDTPSSLGSR